MFSVNCLNEAVPESLCGTHASNGAQRIDSINHVLNEQVPEVGPGLILILLRSHSTSCCWAIEQNRKKSTPCG